MQILSKIPSSSTITHSTNNRKDFVNSRKMFLNYRLSPQGHFKFSMFTSCSPRKEKAPAKSLQVLDFQCGPDRA